MPARVRFTGFGRHGSRSVACLPYYIFYHTIFLQNPVSEVGAWTLSEHVKLFGDSPVRGVRRYRRDWIVEKKCGEDYHSEGRPEGALVTHFSSRSRYRLLFWTKNCDCDFLSMLTITYPMAFSRDGRHVKNDLDNFKTWLRRTFPEIKGIWFLEFQMRGAPHFHLLLSLELPHLGEVVMKKRTRKHDSHTSQSYRTVQSVEDKASLAWYRIVGSGDEKHLRAGVCWEILENSEAAIRYAGKHAAKPHQKQVPEQYMSVGRFWGKFGGLKIVGGEDLEFCTTEQLFRIVGCDAVSSKGRVKKYLFDASELPIEK